MNIGLAILGMTVAAFLGFLLACLLAMAGHSSAEEKAAFWKQEADRYSALCQNLRRELDAANSYAGYWIRCYRRLHKDYKLLRDGGCGKNCECGDIPGDLWENDGEVYAADIPSVMQ